MLDSVTTAGIERSMPRAISTSVSPMAAMARKAASGMIARNVDGSRLRGTTIAQTTSKADHREPDRGEAHLDAPAAKN